MAGPSPVSPTAQAPKWHMTLTDGEDTLGFVLHNQQGRRDEKAKRRYPLRSDAIKIQQGESKYSDNDPKFSAIVQEDWSGGRGADKFEDDKTRFAEGYGVDTFNTGALTIGPARHYGIGYRGSYNNLDDTIYQRTKLLNSDGGRYWATKFTAPAHLAGATNAVYNVRIYHRNFGDPAAMTVRLRADSAGVPGSVLKSTTHAKAGSGGTLGTDLSFANIQFSTAETLTQGNDYWLELIGDASDDEDNYWEIIGKGGQTAGTAKKSTDGSSYSNVTYGIQFRLTDVDNPFIARFFEYLGQFYFFTDYDDNVAGELWMNGWRGAADSNSANKARLNDATQDFSVPYFDAKIARVLTGAASAYEKPDWRRVTAGANQYVTVSPSWLYTHDTSDDYVLMGSDYFQAITMPTSGWDSNPVTDVAIDTDKIFVFKGELSSAWLHREYNSAGVWTAGGTSENWVKASGFVGSLAVIHRDPVLGNVLYSAHEPAERHSYIPEIIKSYVPKGWSTSGISLNQIMLWDGYTDDWTSDDGTYVTVTNRDNLREVEIQVRQGVITGGTVSSGGTGYQVGDTLTVDEWSGSGHPGNYTDPNSGNNATFQVTSVDGGVVDGISLVSGGFDYSDGIRATTGGNGSGCTISITTSGFGNGLMAHVDLSTIFDGRQMTKITTFLQSTITIAANDITLTVDNNTGATSPFLSANIGLIKAGTGRGREGSGGGVYTFEFDPEDYDGLQKITSLGLTLNSTIHSFNLLLKFWVRMQAVFDPIPLGEAGEQINNLKIYGDPKTVWVLTDRSIYEMRGGHPVEIQLDEIRQVRSWVNGQAAAVNDVYLYVGFGEGVHRYYRQQLENVSPVTEYTYRTWELKGVIASMISYPGRVYAGSDGTYTKTDRKSWVRAFEGRAWHEVYTSEGTSERIRSMYIQNIEGHSDRLWISNGPDVFWVPQMMGSSLRADPDSDYRTAPEGIIETAWIYSGKQDLAKVFRSITLWTDDTSGTFTRISPGRIDMFYKVDNDTSWTEIGSINPLTSTAQTTNIGANGYVTGKRIKFKFRLWCYNGHSAPVMRAFVLKYYAIEPNKYGYIWTTLLTEKDLSINLEGDQDLTCGYSATVEAALAKLDEWSAGTTPLTQNSVYSAYDNVIVTLKHVPAQADKVLPDEQIESHILQVNTEAL